MTNSRKLKERKLLLLREKLRRSASASLHEFVAQAWSVVVPSSPFADNWHVGAICAHLEAVSRGEIRRLLINVPFRTAKSTIVSVMWPSWTWIHHPEHQWLTGSYAASLAVRDNLAMRRLIQSRWYQERWGREFMLTDQSDWGDPLGFVLTGDQNTKVRFENDRNGYRRAFGAGNVMGDGGDTIIVDDPHDRQGAESDAERETALENFDGAISTRLNQPANGAIVIIMQRLHESDLSGHVLATGEYEHLLIPMHYDPKRSRVTVIGWKDPRTEPGELMHPERFPEATVKALEVTLGEYGAAGQLEQAPSPPGGGILKEAWWKFYEDAEIEGIKFDEEIQSWDCAVKDTADYVAGQAWGRKGATIYLLPEDVYARLDMPATLTAFREFSKRFPFAAKLVEDKANGPAVIAMLKDEIPGLIAVNPEGDKVARARAVSPYIEAGNVKLPNPYDSAGQKRPDRLWVLRLIANCSKFPNAEHDDDVDALTQAIHKLQHGIGNSEGFFRFILQDTERLRTLQAVRG